MEIVDINAKKPILEIYYFVPINSNIYKKNNLDKTYPHNCLNHDISGLRNEGNILLIGDFNTN